MQVSQRAERKTEHLWPQFDYALMQNGLTVAYA